jgi:predicted MFS family arabinose efflux permease
MSTTIASQSEALSVQNTTHVDAKPELTRALLMTMAVACGLGIANLYYNQPLLPQIARSLHVTIRQVGSLPVLAQVGFGIGVFFIAPLGDLFERRRLILTMLALVTLATTAAAFAPNLTCLAVASFAIGITSVISTLVMPFAVALSRPEERGKTVGTIASALLIGVLLSRTLSGVVGEMFGWRVMYGIAGVLMIALVLLMRALLPRSPAGTAMPYRRLLISLFHLFRQEAVLREATVNGMLCYGALSAFWATLVFYVESPVYGYGAAVAGMFGLVAALCALAAPLIGKLTDQRSPRLIVGWAVAFMLLGFVELWCIGEHLWGLIVGVILLDLAAQCATISNQVSVYSLAPEAQSRLYTVYRAAYSVGGALGAFLGVYAWSLYHWNGVCAVGCTLLALALLLHHKAQRAHRSTQRSPEAVVS